MLEHYYDGVDMGGLRALLHFWLDRARGLVEARGPDHPSYDLVPSTGRLLDAAEGLVLGAKSFTRAEAEKIVFWGLIVRGYNGRDPELETVLSSVSSVFDAIVDRLHPQPPEFVDPRTGDEPRSPAQLTQEEQALAKPALEISLRLSVLQEEAVVALDPFVSAEPLTAASAQVRTDEVRALSERLALRFRSPGLRRAIRLALSGDPSGATLAAGSLSHVYENAVYSYGTEWVERMEEGALGGRLGALQMLAREALVLLEPVQDVFGRPAEPLAPEASAERVTATTLYRLALAHGALRDALDRAAGELGDPWPQALAAIHAGGKQIHVALRESLADPAPGYGAAASLAEQWSAYGATIRRLPLASLPAEGRARVEEQADAVAMLAAELVRAVAALR